MGLATQTVGDEIRDAINEERLVLPSMPEAALRIREAAEDEDASVMSIVSVVGADAAVAARIIKVANSPVFRGVKTIDNLQGAVSRMGIPYTCNLAMGVAMEQLFQATSEAVDERMRASWAHSTEVASLCHIYCQHFTKLKPDQATLAGLVHEIGKLPILVWADDNDWDGAKIDYVVDRLHGKLGQTILASWDFPEEIQNVPLEYLDFSRQVEKPDYTDIVTVANLHAYFGTDHPLGKVDLHKVTAFERLGIDVDNIFGDPDFSEATENASGMI